MIPGLIVIIAISSVPGEINQGGEKEVSDKDCDTTGKSSRGILAV